MAIDAQIAELKDQWGGRLVILGHHYQRPAVLRHCDARGDSLELARLAASRPQAERIIFCGVRFMAESADILSRNDQWVFMPDMTAGCPMANMADAALLTNALQAIGAGGVDWCPVVYVNSTAEVKAICGQRQGSTCTSSNAAQVMDWALKKGRRVFFLPDEHLGRNTACDLGIPDNAVRLFDPRKLRGGLSRSELDDCRVLVWKGFCIVHLAFTVEQVQAVRQRFPNARIIVHPESPHEVVAACDAHGSTAQIIRYVENTPDGGTVIVGTELNLVERLAQEHAGRITVKALHPSLCANMAKTTEASLLELLEHWPELNRIRVDEATKADARRALEQMLAL